MFRNEFEKTQGSKKPNTDISYINDPNFGRTYSVFNLVLEVYKVMKVVGFVPTIYTKIFLMINL